MGAFTYVNRPELKGCPHLEIGTIEVAEVKEM